MEIINQVKGSSVESTIEMYQPLSREREKIKCINIRDEKETLVQFLQEFKKDNRADIMNKYLLANLTI